MKFKSLLNYEIINKYKGIYNNEDVITKKYIIDSIITALFEKNNIGKVHPIIYELYEETSIEDFLIKYNGNNFFLDNYGLGKFLRNALFSFTYNYELNEEKIRLLEVLIEKEIFDSTNISNNYYEKLLNTKIEN